MVQSVAYRTGEQEVACSIPELGQYSFRRLMIVIVTGFIPGKAASGFERILSGVLVKKEFQESMDRYTGRRDIFEALLKTALSAIQSSELRECIKSFSHGGYSFRFVT